MSLHHMLRAAAGYQAPAPANTDPQFNYVSLLLHGDGTNGAQNNTFLDSSSNNFTITRNGNTTQGSLSPYGNLWSNFFDGNGDYLTIPANTAFDFAAGNFTVEGWIYINANATLDPDSIRQANICACMFDDTPASGWHFSVTGNSTTTGTGLMFDVWNSGSKTSFSASSTISQNTWNHVAVVRNGSSLSLYLNGTSILSTTISVSVNSGGNGFDIGSLQQGTAPKYYWYFPGYISNLRVVKGTAVYTSAFTPPTAPLTAISGTSLLTCQSNRFIDNSANNFTITRNGDVRVTKEAPFLPTAAYSTSVIGGSGYFDGAGDGLTTSNATAFALSGTDFTIEAWINLTGYSSSYGGNYGAAICTSKSGGSTNSGFEFDVLGTASSYTSLAFVARNGSSNTVFLNPSFTFLLNTWYHIALVKSGSTFTFYVNGVSISSTTNANTWTNLSDLNVGASGMTGFEYYFPGYISNFRIVKGTAVYTSNFTPPTAPLTAITNTSLLLNFTNAGIFDNAAENDLETVGNAQISTAVKKYGTGSLAFDGTGDCVVVPANPNINITSGDFTIEFWAYPTTQTNSVDSVFGYGYWTTMFYRNGSTWTWEVGNGSSSNYFTLSGTCTANTWQHIALTRSGNTYTFWLNGVAASTTTNSNGPATASRTLAIGLNAHNASPASPQFFTGYVDDFRLTKGYARYTSTFTPPTAAFPDQ